MRQLTPETKKAARREPKAAANTIQTQAYPPLHRVSSTNPGQPEIQSESEPLGALLVYLLARPLPDVERQFGWQLAERWANEFVQGKHQGEAA